LCPSGTPRIAPVAATFTFDPLLNGQLPAISENQALFALLGTTYGADGQSTFALPTAKPIFTATEAPLTHASPYRLFSRRVPESLLLA